MMKIYDITVTGATADWLTTARGQMPLPVFIRKLLVEIASNPEKYNDLTQWSANANPERQRIKNSPQRLY